MSILQIVLTLCNISGIIRNRVSDIIARHCGYAEDGNGSGTFNVHSLFITRSKTGVKISRISTVGWYLLHRNRHFLLGIGEVGHIGKQYQNSLSFQRELLCNRQSQVRYQSTFYDWVGCGVDEHYGMSHYAALLQGISESQVVIVLQSHSSQDDDINLCLKSDSCQQLVVWFTGNGEDWELLALNQSIEQVNHRNTGTNHFVRENTLRRVKRRSADWNHVLRQSRAIVSWHAGTVKDSSQKIIREGYHHWLSEETNLIAGSDTLSTRKYLQGHQVLIQLNYCRITVTNKSQVSVFNTFRSYCNYVTDNRFNFRIYFLHLIAS